MDNFNVIGNRVNVLLQKYMTEEGYNLWLELYLKIPPIWNRLVTIYKKKGLLS